MTTLPVSRLHHGPSIAWLALAASLAACGSGDGAETFSLGGLASGLAQGRSLVLQNNGRDDLALAANGPFIFGAGLQDGSTYAVRILAQPIGQTCTVNNGSGSIAGAPVHAVQVACSASTFGLPEGDWSAAACLATATRQGMRSLLRITRQDEVRATITYGAVVYANQDCTGPATVQPEQGAGSIVIDRKEARGASTTFWGNWTVAPDTALRSAWTLEGPQLCLLTEGRTGFPSRAMVEKNESTFAPLRQCYSQVP
jgi:hypothetical protein